MVEMVWIKKNGIWSFYHEKREKREK